MHIKLKTRNIRMTWENYFQKEKFFQKRINFNNELKTDYILDLICNLEDTTECIKEFEQICTNSSETDLHMIILLQVGLLQNLYVQQDLITELLEIFSLKKEKKSFKKDIKVVRTLRNKLIGHPISKDQKKLESSVLWLDNNDISIVKYRKYPDGEFEKQEDYDVCIREILTSHKKYMNKYLDIIQKKIDGIKNEYFDETKKFL